MTRLYDEIYTPLVEDLLRRVDSELSVTEIRTLDQDRVQIVCTPRFMGECLNLRSVVYVTRAVSDAFKRVSTFCEGRSLDASYDFKTGALNITRQNSQGAQS